MSAAISEEAMHAALEECLVQLLVPLTWIYSTPAVARLAQCPDDVLHRYADGDEAAGKEISLSESELRSLCVKTYRYAWLGEQEERLDINALVTDFNLFSQIIVHMRGLELPSGGFTNFGTTNGVENQLHVVALTNALNARYNLDNGSDLTIEQLAALAGLSEKTIRMAANPRHDGHLRTHKLGNRTVISADDALAWLEQRGDFRPSRLVQFRPGQYQGDATTLAGVLKQARNALGLRTPGEVVARIKGDAMAETTYAALEKETWRPLQAGLDARGLMDLALALELPAPDAFARWVLELSEHRLLAEAKQRIANELNKID